MEQLRLQAEKPSSSEPNDKNNANIIMSIEPPARRVGWFRALFVGFILSFFVVCIILTVQRLREDGPLLAEQLGDFLIEQGIAMPNMEDETPNAIN